MIDTRICLVQDNYILERFEWLARWVAKTSDGKEVFQDDDRYSNELGGVRDSSWLRLANYCKQNNVYLTNVRLQFRQNQLNFPDRGTYCLTLGAGADFLGDGRTHHYFILACPIIDDPNTLSRVWIRTPEMSITRTDNVSMESILQGDFKDAIIRKL